MIRLMELKDIDAVLQLENMLFSHPWNREAYVYELTQNPFASYWVVEEDRSPIAYIGSWLSGDQAQITTLGVDPHFQGNGYAKRLIETILDLCNQEGIPVISLEVRVTNHKAIRLYEHLGFKNVARRSNYYSQPIEDAYLMILERKTHETTRD